MRRPENLTSFTVEVSATAWKQMEHLSLATYQRIRRELELVAARLRPETPVPLPQKRFRSVETRSLTVEGHTVLYEVDLERKRITLREMGGRSLQK
jgi:mRNA-degrading endonuclease RelE of RelBE toxin-antitoxin system